MFEKAPTPEQILGMKPEELKQRLDSSATKDDITGIKDQVAEFSAGLNSLKESLAKLTAPKPPVPEPDLTSDEKTARLLLDPSAAIRDETKDLREQQILTRAELAEMRARQNPKLAGAFRQYGDELVAAAQRMPLESRAQNGFWEWHVRTFVGDKAINGKIGADSFPSLIGSSTIGVNSEGKETDPNEGFTPDVADWLKGRNVPLQKARRISQIMEKNGDPLSLQNYKEAHA